MGRGHTARRRGGIPVDRNDRPRGSHAAPQGGDRAGDGTVAEAIARILTVAQLAAWLTTWSKIGSRSAIDLTSQGDGTPLGIYLAVEGYPCYISAHGLTPAGEPDVLIPLPPALLRFDALCEAWPGEVITAGEALGLLYQAARNDDGDGEE